MLSIVAQECRRIVRLQWFSSSMTARVLHAVPRLLGGGTRRSVRRRRAALLAAAVVLPHAAAADMKLCNATSSRVGVAIGYKDDKGWATEGWWNISALTCETLLKGELPSRFIYVHAIDYDRGGEWGGANYMCTADKSFSIRDVHECQKRGFKRTGFFEVDTGEAKDWTVRLTDTETAGAKLK